MLYQETLPRFWFVSCVDILLTIFQIDMHRQILASTFEKAKSANLLLFPQNGCLFMWGAYFCMCVYKCNVVPEIKMGAYIYEVLILCGCLLSRFYGSSKLLHYDLSSYQAKVVTLTVFHSAQAVGR